MKHADIGLTRMACEGEPSLNTPKANSMIKYYYPDGTHCYRALHTAHAVYQNDDGKLIARAEKPDRSAMYEFEIVAFELVEAGVRQT